MVLEITPQVLYEEELSVYVETVIPEPPMESAVSRRGYRAYVGHTSVHESVHGKISLGFSLQLYFICTKHDRDAALARRVETLYGSSMRGSATNVPSQSQQPPF